MSKMYFLTEAKKLELVKYQKAIDRKTLAKDHIAFSGSLKQHPYDVEKVILLADPYGSDMLFYEFSNDDIAYAEKLPNVVNSQGEDKTMVMLWVKKGSVAIRSAAFLVEDLN